MKNKTSYKIPAVRAGYLKSIYSLMMAAIFAVVVMAGCNSGNQDRNGVDSAMDINDQKIADSAIAVGNNESDFMVKAANGGMTEVQAAKIAEQKATSADVKAFASKMDKDHSKLNDQLTSLAGTLNITVPAAVDADSKSMIDKLNTTKVADFDKTYMDMMVKAHNNDVDLFQKASGDVANPDVHDFITSALPTLQAHQQMAKKLQSSLK